NPTSLSEIYTLSLHDALPICETVQRLSIPRHWIEHPNGSIRVCPCLCLRRQGEIQSNKRILSPIKQPRGNCEMLHVKQTLPVVLDRKSTRLNSSHVSISYAVF